jgi:hypothetical protein
MFGWDQRTAFKNREDAMARVANIPDTALMIYNAVHSAEVLRYNKRSKRLAEYSDTHEVFFRFSVMLANRARQPDMITDIERTRLQISLTQNKLDLDLCERMVTIQAIWHEAASENSEKEIWHEAASENSEEEIWHEAASENSEEASSNA